MRASLVKILDSNKITFLLFCYLVGVPRLLCHVLVSRHLSHTRGDWPTDRPIGSGPLLRVSSHDTCCSVLTAIQVGVFDSLFEREDCDLIRGPYLNTIGFLVWHGFLILIASQESSKSGRISADYILDYITTKGCPSSRSLPFMLIVSSSFSFL